MAEQTTETKAGTITPTPAAPQQGATPAPAARKGGMNPRVQLKRGLQAMGFDQQSSLLGMSPAVQRRGGGGTDGVHAAAARGIAGGGGAMPHGQQIQKAFGAHDISGIQAHTGSQAREASAAMGAEAYATGDHVAFGGAPDLHTAAHEAAHVIQQQHGVSLSGGVGQAGDSYEQHADRVADAVVAGKSAEPILDTMTGGGAGGAVQKRAVQQRAVQMDAAAGAATQGASPTAPTTPAAPPPTRAPMPSGGTLVAVPAHQIPPNPSGLVSPTDATQGGAKADDFNGPAGAQDIDATMAAMQNVADAHARVPTAPLGTPPPAPTLGPPKAVGTVEQIDSPQTVQEHQRVTTAHAQPPIDFQAIDPAQSPTGQTFLANQGQLAPHPNAAPAPAGHAKPARTPVAPTPPAPAAVDASGLALQVNMGPFTAAALAVQADWETLTPAQRGQRLGDAARDALAAVGVPVTGTVVKPLATGGNLDFRTWNINISETELSKATITTAEMSQLAGLVYHEARHAEQWYNMARIIAGNYGLTEAEIAGHMEIPIGVARTAKTNKFTNAAPPSPAMMSWFNSVYDAAGAAHRSTTLTTFERELVQIQAKTAAWKLKDEARTAKFNETQRAYDACGVKGVEWRALKTRVDDAQRDRDTKRAAYDRAVADNQTKETEHTTRKAALDQALTVWQQRNEVERTRAATWHTKKAAYDTASSAANAKKTALDTLGRTLTEHVAARDRALATHRQNMEDYERLASNPAATDVAKTNALEHCRSFYNGTLTTAWNQHHQTKTAYEAMEIEYVQLRSDYSTAKTEFEQAHTSWTEANTAKTQAEAAWTTANTALGEARRAWEAAWQQVLETHRIGTEAHNAHAALETELAGLYTAWNELDQANKRAYAEWDALNTEWKQMETDYNTMKTTYDPAEAAYKGLPEEVDAYYVGNELGVLYKTKYGG